MSFPNPRLIPIALAALLAAAPASAAVFVVNSTADVIDATPGNGSCNPVDAIGDTCTLRAAIMEANALGGSHTLLVASGNYSLTRTGAGEDAASTGDLDIEADITLVNGTSSRPLVVGSGDRVFDVLAGGRLRLDFIAVSFGVANAPGTVHGGGIRVAQGAELELDRAVIATNYGNIGGGIYSDGDVSIVDSELYNNALVDDEVLAEFVNGAAILSRGTLEVRSSTLRDNGVIPGADGLGLTTSDSAIHLRNNGPANPSMLMVNSTVAGNTRGIESEGVPTTIQQSTIADNGFRGLRFTRDLGDLGNVQLTVRQTVIVGHTSDCNDLVGTELEYDIRNRSNASGDQSCGFSGGSDIEDISWPFIGELGEYGGPTRTLIPNPLGALVDAGGQLCFPDAFDQRGVSRPLDGDLDAVSSCDIGAVEYEAGVDPLPPLELFRDGFEAIP